jgi:hypothetical protein
MYRKAMKAERCGGRAVKTAPTITAGNAFSELFLKPEASSPKPLRSLSIRR